MAGFWSAAVFVDTLSKRTAAFERGPLRDAALARACASLDATQVVRAVQVVHGEALRGSVSRRVLLDDIAQWIARGGLGEERTADAGARAVELAPETAALFETEQSWHNDAVAPVLRPRPGSLEALGEPLGRRRALARTAVGDAADRLALDSDAVVIQHLLANPRTTAQHAVRIAARRPVPWQVLETASKSRFAKDLGVRRAIALNPDARPALACASLNGLPAASLREVAMDSRLSAHVRQAARRMLIEAGASTAGLVNIPGPDPA